MNSFKLYKQSKPTQLSFLEWLFEQEQVVHAFMQANPKKQDDREKDFLIFYGNTFDIKDKLKEFGFRYFQGSWSTPRFRLNNDLVNKLSELSNIQDLKNIIDAGPIPDAEEETTGQAQETEPKGKVDIILRNMEKEVEDAQKKTTGKGASKAKQILGAIERHLEKLANLVDEEAKSQFVKDLLKFSAKFHNYSFNNQILIYAQKKDATFINSAKRWMDLGRVVKNWNEGITILAPITAKRKEEEEGQDPASSFSSLIQKSGKESRRPIWFKAVKVYDVSATKVIPGQEDKAKVFEPNDWRQDTDENTEELTLMVNAGLKFAKGIATVDYEELAAGMGGYSAGGKIVINNTYGGINKFSTLVHELAHEILHQTLSAEQRSKMSKEDLEYDAESTAYIVLQYFGFETKDSSRYLALWKGTGEKIKNRRESISKASKEIIVGLKKNIEKMVIAHDEEESEKEEEPVAV